VSILVAVTDHAAERFRQRVGSRLGLVDVKPEIVGRVVRAWEAGRVEDEGRGRLRVRDLVDRDVVFVCTREGAEVVVVTLWEEGDEARVPRRFTDALERHEREQQRARGRKPPG
jgi:hypothetical protein